MLERWLPVTINGHLITVYLLKHGGAESTTLEALKDPMTVMRFSHIFPCLRNPRSLREGRSSPGWPASGGATRGFATGEDSPGA